MQLYILNVGEPQINLTFKLEIVAFIQINLLSMSSYELQLDLEKGYFVIIMLF